MVGFGFKFRIRQIVKVVFCNMRFSNIRKVVECDMTKFVPIQRARSKMVGGDRQKMMQMLRIGFEYAFKDDNQ